MGGAPPCSIRERRQSGRIRMDAVHVLLCDLGAANGVGQSVRDILASDQDHRFIVRHQALSWPAARPLARQSLRLPSKPFPAISFLLCGTPWPEGCAEIIPALPADRSDTPLRLRTATSDPAT